MEPHACKAVAMQKQPLQALRVVKNHALIVANPATCENRTDLGSAM